MRQRLAFDIVCYENYKHIHVWRYKLLLCIVFCVVFFFFTYFQMELVIVLRNITKKQKLCSGPTSSPFRNHKTILLACLSHWKELPVGWNYWVTVSLFSHLIENALPFKQWKFFFWHLYPQKVKMFQDNDKIMKLPVTALIMKLNNKSIKINDITKLIDTIRNNTYQWKLMTKLWK